jgi:predicted enzyme related to lactoylglutathione lyase
MATATVIPVSDLATAKASYTILLGRQPHTDAPFYVGFDVDGHEVGLTPKAQVPEASPVLYVDVADLDGTRTKLLEAGATERTPPRQVAPGIRVCVLIDADGNPMGLRGA